MTLAEETAAKIQAENAQGRAWFTQQSSRLVSAFRAEGMDQLNEFLDDLATGTGEAQEGSGEDTTDGPTESS